MNLYAPSIEGFTGRVVTPADGDYDAARAIWNAMHDRRPALVAYCASAGDVAAAIRHGRAHDLPIAVRGGGHSMPGHSVCDGGIVIDLRGLDAVDVDPVARRVRVGGGALLGELDRATQAHGLVVPAGVVSHTGVGGLTLGGGVGRLMRRFGLTVDSLLSAEVVTADGDVLTASADEHPDLFWGLRGGGGNFGVVTAFTFACHVLSEVLILATFHPLDRARAVLERGRDAMAGPAAPDALLWTSFLRKAPPAPWMPPALVGTPGVLSLVEWSGDRAEGAPLLEAIGKELAPAASSLDPWPFLAIQTLTDDLFAAGQQTYIKAGFATALTDGLIDALLGAAAGVGSPLSQIEVLALGGAIARVGAGATAFPHRDAAWLLNIPAMWTDPGDTEAEVAWARASYAALAPHLTGGTYVNFMAGDEDGVGAGVHARTLARLQAVKATYDPNNVFRLNQNVAPSASPSPSRP
jgi:FAD/FMN-containing dehydrogenase